jgi:hypothetical protein
VTTLLNTLKETYYRSSVTDVINNLKKLHFKLLTKVVEETLIFEGSRKQSESNWKFAVSLIAYSNVSRRMQLLMINDILFKDVQIASSDIVYLSSKTFDVRTTREALALFHFSNFRIKEALENFKISQNLEKINEIFIFYFFCNSLIQGNIANEIRDEFEDVRKISTNVYFWEKYGVVFWEYLHYLRRFEEGRIDRSYLEGVRNLIKKVEALNSNTSVIYEKIVTYCRNIMLNKLRIIYNKIVPVEQVVSNFYLFLASCLFNSEYDLD